MIRRAGAGAAALVLLLAGCGASSARFAGSHPGDPAGVHGWAGPTSGEHLLVSDGRLYSEQLDHDGGVCFWFVDGAGTTVSLTWPAGWTVRTGPLRVADADGLTRATTFDEGLGFTGHFEAGRTGCAPGGLSRSFAVTRVDQTGPPGR